jgi:hypothetical protein
MSGTAIARPAMNLFRTQTTQPFGEDSGAALTVGGAGGIDDDVYERHEGISFGN